MPANHGHEVNPFESPIKAKGYFAETATSDDGDQRFDILATADLLLGQIKGLELLCSTVEERVQRKRKALKELEYLILGSDSPEGLPHSPACPANTPAGSRLHLASPRLRGLFDQRGPGQANLDSIQSCLDYSPDTRMEELWLSEDWMDDNDDDEDEEVLLLDSPFDDKYVLRQSPRKVEKKLPAIPRGEILESKIPRKVHIRREVSTSKRTTVRPSNAVARSTSHRRRPSVRNVKNTSSSLNPPSKGTMRRSPCKRGMLGSGKTKGSKNSSTNENEIGKDCTRRKEKRKGLWSIYSVCSEFGLSGTPRAI